MVVVVAVEAAEIVERAKSLTTSCFSRDQHGIFLQITRGNFVERGKLYHTLFRTLSQSVDKAKKLTCAKE